MDFKSMKRKELQALCKKHGLPANATNSQMIENLSSILQENLKPKGCLKGSGGSSVEDLGFIRGGSKKVTFSFQDEEEDGDEEFTMNSARKTRRKTVGRRSVVATELEKGSKEIEKGGHYESAKNVPEVPRRATRSRGLAESVVWSPVIEKRRGARGVRQNADVSLDEEEKPVVDEKPSSRSLRSKAVVVGGDKESVAHQGRRNTRKSKSIDKKEENEEVAVSLKEENDNAVGKKNLRKRSREGDDAEDEPPPRRPTRSHAKLEESVDIAEVDSRRSKKRRRVIEALAVKADEEIEKVSETGGTPKRLRGKMSKSNVMDSGHTNDAAGLKKATRQGKMNQEIHTESMLDSKAVTGPTRRLTRSSVALLEVENSVFAVGKSDMEPKTVRRRKSEKQTKGRYAAASLLTDRKVVAEPVRRSTRSTLTSLEDDTSLLVAEKSVKGAVPVLKSKAKKQDHGQTGEGPTTSLLLGKIVEEPIRRSTRSSSTLSEVEASLSVVKKPVERCNLDKSEKRTSGHDLKRPESTVLAVTKAVSEPARRSTRGSSTLSQEKTSVLSHGESVEGYEVAGKGRSQKQASDRGSKRGGSNISLLDANVVAEPVRRSTRHSSNLMEEGASEPVVGKSVKGGELVRKGKSQNQAKDHDSARGGATASPVIGKSVKQGDAVKKGKSQKQDKGNAPEREVSIASVSDNEAVVEPTKRMIRGSSKILKDVSQSPAARKSGDDEEASEKSKAGKRRRDHSSERGGSTASLPESRAIITPIRGSTRSSSKLKGDATSLRAGGNSGGHTDTGRKDNLGKQPMEHILEQGDSTTSLLDNVAVTKSTRRSTRSSLKVGADSEGPKSPWSPHPANKAVTTSARRSSHRSSKGPADSEVLKNPCSLQPDNEAATTPAIRSKCHSLEAPADSEVLKNQCSLQPDSEALTTPARRSAQHLGKAGSEILESPLSEYPDNEAVTKIPPDSEASMNPLCEDNEVFTMSARRSACHSSNVPVDSEAPMSPCFPHIDNEAVTSPARGSACHLSKVSSESEVLKHPSSPYLPSTLLEDILENSHVEAKTSRKEQTNVLQSINVPGREVDTYQTSTGTQLLEEHDALTGSGVNTSILHGGTDLAREILVPSPSNVALAEVRDDADAKIGSEMRQSPVHVTLEEIENDTLVVGTQRELDVVSPSSHDIEGCSSLMEVTDKDRGGSPLSIIEGSSEVQENFTGKFKGSNVDGTVDAKETLESYGDDRVGASAQLEPSDIVLAEFTNDVDAKIASEMGQSPVSVPLKKNENDSSLKGLDEVSLSSDAIEGCSSFMEVINKDRGESPFKIVDGSSEVQEDFLGKPECSNVDSTVDGQGTLESYKEDIDEALAQVEPTSSIIEASSGTFVGAINVDCLASMESQSVVNPPESLKGSEELRTMLEANPDHVDALVTHATSSHSRGKGLERRSLTADPEASPEVPSEEHNSNPEIRAATEVGLQGDRTTYADILALVGKSSKDPLPIAHTDNSTVVDPEQPELKEEVEVPRHNLMAGSGAHNISDLMTSNMEVCPESFCDISIEESDSEVKAHPASKDHMKEGNEATNTASPPASCKFIGVPPTLLATPYNELCQKIDVTESDPHTHAMSRASGIHRKTLEVSMTSESDAGSLMKIQRIFGDEMESCKLESGTMLNAESTPEECDAEEKIEDFIDVRDSESCIGLEIIKEVWISTSPAKMNVGTETERDENCAEKDGDELRPYSPREDPTSVMYSVNDINAQGTLLSPKETVESASTLCSHGDAEQSDFAQCVYDQDPADVDGKRDSFDDEFCENSSKHLLSPGASMKSEGLLYDLPVASKDKESSPSKITVTFSEVVERNSSVANENYIRMLDASDKLVEQQDNQERFLDVNEDYKGISALTVGNRSPSDAVLFEGCSEARDSSTFPVSVIPGEEMLPRTDTPATLGYESSANKGQSQKFSCVGDGEGVRHLLDQGGVALDLSLGVESKYMSPKSAPTGQKASGQLNEDADIVLETVHTAKELADDDHEKSLELDAIDEDALENTGSLEGLACGECKDGAVTRKADGIGWSALDHFDEVCEKQNEAFLLPAIKDLSGELHAGDVASHSASDNSASASGDGRVLPLDNIALPTDIGNVQSLPQRDLVLSDEGQSIKDDTPNASTEEENLNGEESLRSVSSIQFAHPKEGQDSDMLKKKAFSAGSIRPVASPGTSPADSPNFGDNLNEESDGGKNISLRLPCNVRKEYDNQISSVAMSGESKQEDGEYKQEETTQDSPVEIESILKAREKDILPSTSESKHPVSRDTLDNLEATHVATGSECGNENAYNVNNDNEAVLEESPDYKSIISTKIAGAGHGSSHDVSMFISRGAQDSGVTGISENNEASHAGDHSLIGLEKLVDLSNRECLATVVTASSSQVQTRSEQSNTYEALRFAERSKDQEERVQETSGVSECTRDDKFAVLEITKVEGSATVMSKSEKLESSQIVTDAKMEELIVIDAADSATIVTDQVVSWDCTKATGTERRPIGNDLEHSEFGATCTAQHASVLLDTGVDSSAAVRESMARKDEILVTEAEEYFDDFCWSFADSVDVGSSLPKVQEVDSQFPMESTPGNSADHSSKSGKDVNDDENRRADIKQMKDRKECDGSAPMQLVKNSDAYSVIDDVIRNKENMVGLKMDGMRKHNEKSAISGSSRRPLESMRRTESDH